MQNGSKFEKLLNFGKFVVTAELGPPKSADLSIIRRHGECLKGYVDAINVTDNQTAVVRASSLACAVELKSMGLEPIVQVTCRDRNRIALQSDMLGAVGLGIHNILCLSGDHEKFGNEPGAKGVYDLDSIQLLGVASGMKEGRLCGGDKLDGPADIFLGAVENPFADPLNYRILRLRKKVEAGARFIQTQCVFDIELFEKWMEGIRKLGLHERTKILAGLTPVKSARAACYMKEKVPGIVIPDKIIERVARAKDQKEEGINICVETIERLREIEGIAGIHIMAIAWEGVVPTLVERAGLM